MANKLKLTLIANPTFPSTVTVPTPSGPASLDVVFKHKDREQYKEFVKDIDKREDIDVMLEIVESWGLEQEFNRENLQIFMTQYMAGPRAIIEDYFSKLTGAKLGN